MSEHKYSAPAVEKVLNIIELMAHDNKGYTVTEICDKLSMSVNSGFRIFKELERKKYVVKDVYDSKYILTPKLYFLGNSMKSSVGLVEMAQPVLRRINALSRETVILTILGENNSTLVVDQIASPEPIKFLSNIGYSYDSYCSAMGKVLLSSLPEDELNQYIEKLEPIKKTSNTITDKSQLNFEIQKIKQEEIAYDNEESVVGLSCIACPVYTANKHIEAAIGISGVAFRMTDAKKEQFVELLRQETEKLSSVLGSDL